MAKITRGVAGDTLDWAQVTNNSGYTLEKDINNTITTVDLPVNTISFDLSSEQFDTKYRVKAKGTGRYSDADYSNQVIYTQI